jgi:hypothetical protein
MCGCGYFDCSQLHVVMQCSRTMVRWYSSTMAKPRKCTRATMERCIIRNGVKWPFPFVGINHLFSPLFLFFVCGIASVVSVEAVANCFIFHLVPILPCCLFSGRHLNCSPLSNTVTNRMHVFSSLFYFSSLLLLFHLHLLLLLVLLLSSSSSDFFHPLIVQHLVLVLMLT